jgi:1-acyl-sn-glycerol-3-phosphate acyltransferase
MRRWHRHEVRGIEHIPGDRAALVVGYHGRPIAHDLCMLQDVLLERGGVLPHAIFHAAFAQNPRAAQALEQLGFLLGDGPGVEEAVAHRELIFVTPGGTREGCRSLWHRHRVDWGGRLGYLRLALRHRLPIIPVASYGADHAWLGLNNGDEWGRKAGLGEGVPLWVGLGIGLWPLGLPLPARITTQVGEPIELPPLDPADRAALAPWHQRVTRAVQSLLDRGHR